MFQFAADSFPGAPGTELAASNSAWSRHPAYTGVCVLSASGRVRTTTSAAAGYLRSETPPSADYSVSCDLYLAGSDNSANGVIARASSTAATFYHARYFAGAQQVQLYKFVAGSAASLGAGVARSLSAGGTINLRLSVEGTAIRVYVDGSATPIISQTDAAITGAGRVGFRLSTASGSDTGGLHLDNFVAEAADTDVSVGIGVAAEADTALPLGIRMSAAPAVELGVAVGLGVSIGITPASEAGAARPLGVAMSFGPAVELSAALPLGVAMSFSPAVEVGTALPLAAVIGPPVTYTRAPAGAGYIPGVPVLHRPAPAATARPHIAAARRPTR